MHQLPKKIDTQKDKKNNDTSMRAVRPQREPSFQILASTIDVWYSESGRIHTRARSTVVEERAGKCELGSRILYTKLVHSGGYRNLVAFRYCVFIHLRVNWVNGWLVGSSTCKNTQDLKKRQVRFAKRTILIRAVCQLAYDSGDGLPDEVCHH